MKHTRILILLISILGTLFLINCDNGEVVDKEKAKLEVFVKKYTANGPKQGGVSVELYTSKADRDNETNVFKTMSTPTTEIEDNGALFEKLAAQVYYLHVTFTDSNLVFEGIAEISVAENAEASIDVVCNYNGSWQVFVREGNITGPNIGGAKVELFATEADRTNNNPIAVKYTPTTGFETNGAMFEDLPYQMYYLRGSYTNAQGYWIGIAEGYAKKSQTIDKVIVCVL
jgi:hypothetical protein